MPRNCTRLFWVAAVLFILAAGRSHASVVSEHLLPNTTKGVMLVTDAKNLSDTWQKTQVGQLMADPVMKPLPIEHVLLPVMLSPQPAATGSKRGSTRVKRQPCHDDYPYFFF